jgi:hypothetical protein
MVVEWYGLVSQCADTVLHLLRFRHSRKGTGSNAVRCTSPCQDKIVSFGQWQ